MDKVKKINWNGVVLVSVSSVGSDFGKWLYGQTRPVVENESDPYDWAYLWDYERYIAGLPVID